MWTILFKDDPQYCCDTIKVKLLSRLPFGSKMSVMYSVIDYIIIVIEREFGAKESFSACFKLKVKYDDNLLALLERAEARILEFLNRRFYK